MARKMGLAKGQLGEGGHGRRDEAVGLAGDNGDCSEAQGGKGDGAVDGLTRRGERPDQRMRTGYGPWGFQDKRGGGAGQL